LKLNVYTAEDQQPVSLSNEDGMITVSSLETKVGGVIKNLTSRRVNQCWAKLFDFFAKSSKKLAF